MCAGLYHSTVGEVLFAIVAVVLFMALVQLHSTTDMHTVTLYGIDVSMRVIQRLLMCL